MQLESKQQPQEIVPDRPEPEDFAIWRDKPISKWFFAWVGGQFNQIGFALASGETINSDSIDETALATAQHVAQTKALYAVFTADYNRIKEDLYGTPQEEIEDEEL